MTLVCVVGQGFGANANPLYASDQLLGHPGVDDSCGWGTPVKAPYPGRVLKVLTPEHPANDGSGYTAVAWLVDDGIECFEWTEGHLTPSVTAGIDLHRGDIIGTEANHGQVYSGNIPITLAMQKAGDQRGHHRHSQKRPVMAVRSTTPSGTYLTSQNASPYYDGTFYYQVVSPRNGYAGCISPLAPLFARSLYVGCSGYDVYCLQRFLACEGHFKADPTGYYGVITAAAVVAYQTANGITPNLGFFGPITRTSVLRKLNWQPYYGPVE